MVSAVAVRATARMAKIGVNFMVISRYIKRLLLLILSFVNRSVGDVLGILCCSKTRKQRLHFILHRNSDEQTRIIQSSSCLLLEVQSFDLPNERISYPSLSVSLGVPEATKTPSGQALEALS